MKLALSKEQVVLRPTGAAPLCAYCNYLLQNVVRLQAVFLKERGALSDRREYSPCCQSLRGNNQSSPLRNKIATIFQSAMFCSLWLVSNLFAFAACQKQRLGRFIHI